jgi:hypothetical protein
MEVSLGLLRCACCFTAPPRSPVGKQNSSSISYTFAALVYATTGVVVQPGAATFDAAATLTAGGTQQAPAAATLGATVTLTAGATQTAPATFALAATGNLTATGARDTGAAMPLSATATLVAVRFIRVRPDLADLEAW